MHDLSDPQPGCKLCRRRMLWFFRGVVLAAGGDPIAMTLAASW